MSFKDDYKNQIESLSADGYLKQKVLNKMEETQNSKKQRSFPLFRTMAVAVTCIILAVAVAVPHLTDVFKGDIEIDEETASEDLTIAKEEEATAFKNLSYDEIYDKVSEICEDIYWVDGDKVILYDEGATTGTNTKGGNAAPRDDNEGIMEEADDFSETTAQVEGVGEADVVKTDGKYIYALSLRDRKLRIIKAGKNPEKVSEIFLENPYKGQNIYIYKDRLVIFGTKVVDKTTEIYIYDIKNPEEPKKLIKCSQSGEYTDSRLIGDKLYIISEHLINTNDIDRPNPASFVPSIVCKDYNGPMEAKCVYVNEVRNSASYTVICSYDITDGSMKGSQSVLGGTYALYCSTNNIITAGFSENNRTAVTRYEIKDGKITLKAEGKIKGGLLNQFSIDEYKGNFRFVTNYTYGEESRSEGSGSSGTVYYRMIQGNMVTILDGNLKQIGAIEKIAPDEKIYSVRFMGDMAYFVTFRQVDPLFSADLSDPENPKIVGSLKIPGFSNYLFPYGDNKLLGIGQDADENTGISGGIKLSMFDISNPADVKEISKEILDINSSDALYSHKNSVVLPDKNIIGFDIYNNGRGYLIYGFTGGKFIKKAQIDLGNTGLYAKGLYIGKEFYIVTNDGVTVFNMDSFEKIGEVEF